MILVIAFGSFFDFVHNTLPFSFFMCRNVYLFPPLDANLTYHELLKFCLSINTFYQQKGRYPIHFHKCGDTPSFVSKNLIINSNQRCVFIHNTNKVTIDDNVAYNTAGHCYATETGAEHNNFFTNNLGAHTKKLWRSNGQSDSAVGFHKHQAATFWLRNMENTL